MLLKPGIRAGRVQIVLFQNNTWTGVTKKVHGVQNFHDRPLI